MATNSSDAGNVAPPLPFPDAHGRAALLLIESLINVLLKRGLLTIDDALAVTSAEAEVKEEAAIAEHSDPTPTGRHSLRLIRSIDASLMIDRNGQSTHSTRP